MDTHDRSAKNSVDSNTKQNIQKAPIESGSLNLDPMLRAAYRTNRKTPSSSTVLQMQQIIGNKAVQRILAEQIAAPVPTTLDSSKSYPVVQRVKLANTVHVKTFLTAPEKKKQLFGGLDVGGFFSDFDLPSVSENPANAQAEIASLNKRDFIELMNDLTFNQLKQLEDKIPGLTARIDNIFQPHNYVAGVQGVQNIPGIGSFQVVNDGINVEELDYGTLTATQFQSLNAEWNKINNSFGKLIIMGESEKGIKYPNFRQDVLNLIGKLMSRPYGRQLITTLNNGTHWIMIRPVDVSTLLTPQTNTRQMGQTITADPAHATPMSMDAFNPSVGSGSVVEMDPKLQDDTTKLHDKDGTEISAPLFVTLGHELIHAKHNTEGKNEGKIVNHPKYTNKEEQTTIEQGENLIRSEHLEKRLSQRFGHSGRDTRVW